MGAPKLWVCLGCICTIWQFAAATSGSMISPGLNRPSAVCNKWDYLDYPVTVTTTCNVFPGRWPRWAFDGYPAAPFQPYPHDWWSAEAPTKGHAATLSVDYTRPVAVTRFVHYFDASRTPTCWKDVDIESSSDGESWVLLQSFINLPADYPQVLAIDRPVRARHYRFVIKALADGAPGIVTYEIETYFGASMGAIECKRATQTEACRLNVRVLSPDAPLSAGKVKLSAPKNTLVMTAEEQLPPIAAGGTATASFRIIPLVVGPVQILAELIVEGKVVDQRPFTLRVSPKLEFSHITPEQAMHAKMGEQLAVSGTVTNRGTSVSRRVTVTWLGSRADLGDLSPGQSAPFALKARARSGFSTGRLSVKDSSGARSVLQRPVICPTQDRIVAGLSHWVLASDHAEISIQPAPRRSPIAMALRLFASGKPCSLHAVSPCRLAAIVLGGVFTVDIEQPTGTRSLKLFCSVLPEDPNPAIPSWLDIELRIAVQNPKVMFRPHIDWYTAERGPNVPQPVNAHYSATRMLCIQTDGATLSAVPDTDNLTWGFTPDNQMTCSFQIPLTQLDPHRLGIWRPISESPTHFSMLLIARAGDWWDAYRHVVQEVFHFEQPRQWAMPVTQMQMLNIRYLLRHEVWSEKWQTIRSFPDIDLFFNFYGTTYTLPALYSWYLATDDREARLKAGKVLDWLLSVQEKEGPNAGAWFSQYHAEGDRLVGRDQAGNRWVMPHSTGSAAKTLLWYWEASGKREERVLRAAARACDWLLANQRPDGGWPYAFDLDGRPVTHLGDAGQIWCTWALWKMYRATGEDKYRVAANRSAQYFKNTFLAVHRYLGYWEDVSGGAGKVTRSWEGYEPAIAVLVFSEMGDKDLAIEAAKDAALWSWTRVISTRQYETCYGQTTEQSFCGPSQAQSPMIGVALEQAYELTGDPLWSDFAGAIKAINFCADPDQAYGMCATTGWADPTTAVAGPPYDNVRPWITAGNSQGDEYGRGVWAEWQTSQFAWLALEWLIREANLRAPGYVKIDPVTLRGLVLGAAGRVKMPEERADIHGVQHYDFNWIGCQNDAKYVLIVMNHKERVTVAVRPHEAHLGVYTRKPKVVVGISGAFREVPVVKTGVEYLVNIPSKGTAIFIWDRIK